MSEQDRQGHSPLTEGLGPANARIYECEDCIGMREHGCYCQAMGAAQPGGPAKLTPETMKRLGYYNWKGQPDRLVYLGRNWSGNGWWHQFRKIGDPRRVWCEVLDADLHMLEETTDGNDEPDPDPHEDPAAIFGDPRA